MSRLSASGVEQLASTRRSYSDHFEYRLKREQYQVLTRRAMVVLNAGLFIVAVNAIIYWLIGAFVFMTLSIAQFVGFCVAYFWIWRGRDTVKGVLWASLIFLASIISFASQSGGVLSPTLHWMLIIPFVVVLTDSLRNGVILTALSLLGFLGLAAVFNYSDALQSVELQGFSLEGHAILVTVTMLLVLTLLGGIFLREGRDSNAKLDSILFTDPLTGLPNRRLLDRDDFDCVDIQRYVFFVDIDGFKSVNDTVGHHGGDQLLITVASILEKTLQDCCKTNKYTVSRFGGDEFVVVVWVAKNINMDVLGNALKKALRFKYRLSAFEIQCTASIGVALCRKNQSLSDVISNADLAMYTAKYRGGDTVVRFEPTMALERTRQHRYRLVVQEILDNDSFGLVFQPIIDLQSNAIVMVECLFRPSQRHHDGFNIEGLIGAAEASGQIQRLGREVARKVAKLISEIPKNLSQPLFSINISAIDLLSVDYAARMREAFLQAGVDPCRIVLEITESQFVRQDRIVGETFNELKAAGFSFALDDFGTRFSSLDQIRRFELKYLKIDGSFVTGLRGQMMAEPSLVRAMIRMAQSLKMRVVAEGVESEEQLEALREMGCELGQGYGLKRPMELNELVKLL